MSVSKYSMACMRIEVLSLCLFGCGAMIAPDGGASDAEVELDSGPDAGRTSDAGGCSDPDRDRDGWFDPACGSGERFADCDDDDPLRNPGRREVCDPAHVDEDCDPCTVGGDADGDGYVNARCCNSVADAFPSACADQSLALRSDGLICGTDCNDTNDDIHPGAEELCNGLDDDCDGWADSNAPVLVYADLDRDGHGDPGGATRMECVPPTGFSGTNDDCDDTDARVSPSALEGCNGIDDDCDGETDETPLGLGLPCELPGRCAGSGATGCEAGAVVCASPLATAEECNRIDDDCDGETDESITTDCAAHGCGAVAASGCVGGELACWYHSFPDRPGPSHPCLTYTETCQPDGTWSATRVTAVAPPRACSNACGVGVEVCREPGWSACSATGEVSCGPAACPGAALGQTVPYAQCSAGEWGACAPEQIGERTLRLTLADFAGGDPYCRPGQVVSSMTGPSERCALGTVTRTLEPGRYRVCMRLTSPFVAGGIEATEGATYSFGFVPASEASWSIAGASASSNVTSMTRGAAVATSVPARPDDYHWRVTMPATALTCAELTVSSCGSVDATLDGLRAGPAYQTFMDRCESVCSPVPGGEVCRRECQPVPVGPFVTRGSTEVRLLDSFFMERLE